MAVSSLAIKKKLLQFPIPTKLFLNGERIKESTLSVTSIEQPHSIPNGNGIGTFPHVDVQFVDDPEDLEKVAEEVDLGPFDFLLCSILKNSWQDGVLGTNCAIPPNSNYTYKFQTKEQIGSFNYFPSTAIHRAAGGYGGLNIYERPRIPIPFPNPDGDLTLLICDCTILKFSTNLARLAFGELHLLLKQLNKALKQYIERAVRVYWESQFLQQMEQLKNINSEAAQYVTDAKIERWARAYSPRKRYKLMSTNIAEAMNNAIKE
ncbi:hypothetical protein LWI28_023630 [Acer negundo]|uniref:Plastocyanin-like domain-containing protein n=1 Tax=Acer negundo TaxID=4023 RepID=A0AAD5NWI3_ACENE|nr:hypothetical protein LWI28_023630 [Acer negundo]